jgi:hypothetical protein
MLARRPIHHKLVAKLLSQKRLEEKARRITKRDRLWGKEGEIRRNRWDDKRKEENDS